MSARSQREAIFAAREKIEKHLEKCNHPLMNSSENADAAVAKPDAPERPRSTLPTWTHQVGKADMDFVLQFHEPSELRGAVNAMMRLIEKHGIQELQRVGVISHGSTIYMKEIALAAKVYNIPVYSEQPTSSADAQKGEAPLLDISRLEIDEQLNLIPNATANTSANAIPFPPYDDIDVIQGQGTFALELERQMTAPAPNPFADKSRLVTRPDVVISDLDSGITLSGICMAFAGTGTRVFGAAPATGFWDHAWKDYSPRTPVEEDPGHQYWSDTKHPMSTIPWATFTAPNQLSGVFEVSNEQMYAASILARDHYRFPLAFDEAVPLAAALYNEDFQRLLAKDARETKRGRKIVVGVILRSRKVRH